MKIQTPQELHQQFKEWGSQRHKLKNKMLLILPEIYESAIWRKYAGSITEYAGKYGDIAKSTVLKRLRLERNLEDKPELRRAIGQAGVHKVAMVAKLATPETDTALANKVISMSKSAVQILSKELRRKNMKLGDNEFGKVLLGHTVAKAIPRTIRLELNAEMTFLFLKIKKKIGNNMTNIEVMKKILEKVNIEEKLTEIKGKKARNGKSVTGETFGKISRHIPIAKKHETLSKTDGQCAYPGCNSPHDVLHHIDRFSENNNHQSVIALCKEHHEFAHNGLILNEQDESSQWEISTQIDNRGFADHQYCQSRKFARCD